MASIDWKTVFKKIILGESESACPVSVSEVETKKEERDGQDCTEQAKSSKNECTKSDNNFSPKCKSNIDLHSDTSLHHTSHLVNKDLNCTKKNASKIPCNISNDKTAPEWDKVFKDILSKPSMAEKTPSAEKVYNSPMIVIPKAKRRPRPPVPCQKKVNVEEEKVKKIFAEWRTFKPTEVSYNLNDFDGAGVNIFKNCDKTADPAARSSRNLSASHGDAVNSASVTHQANCKANTHSKRMPLHRSEFTNQPSFNNLRSVHQTRTGPSLNLNDFDGAGVNVFKFQEQNSARMSKKESEDEPNFRSGFIKTCHSESIY